VKLLLDENLSPAAAVALAADGIASPPHHRRATRSGDFSAIEAGSVIIIAHCTCT
jgi:hypothetical protein